MLEGLIVENLKPIQFKDLCQKRHFIWVSMVFSMEVLIGDTVFMSPTGDGTAILWAMRSINRLQCKESTFISQLF